MSVAQHIEISCDNIACSEVFVNDRSLIDARAASIAAGWRTTFHYMSGDRILDPDERVLQDFCPAHPEQNFDWDIWRAKRRVKQASQGHHLGGEQS